MLVVTGEITINGSLDHVYACFWNAELWPRITPHVKQVEMVEQDQHRQRFRMVVESRGKQYQMETERCSFPNEMITYRQAHPPPIFRKHSGDWKFRQTENGVQVQLTHRVVLNQEMAKKVLGLNSISAVTETVTSILKNNGSTTMSAIKAFVEEGAADLSAVQTTWNGVRLS